LGSDLYLAASGASARLRDLDVVANNLANADSTGFKRDAAIFEASLAAALRDPEGHPLPGPDATAFVDASLVATDFAPGPVSTTGAPLDVAIRGPGFFEVETPEGPRYTRAGSFVVNAARQLSTPDAHPVLGEGGPIGLSSRPAEIRASGEVVDDQGAVLGRLRVVDFDSPQGLEKAGDGLFRAPDGLSPIPRPDAVLLPRSLERSNVVPVKELTTLLLLQRAFEMNMQVIATDDQMTQQLLQEVQQ
jgi:flagellar basal body rod protein FlgG